MVIVALVSGSCREQAPKHPYQDVAHFSKTFGRDKTYRLYLPQSYHDQEAKQYPVIYFFHGWGGRYGSDDNAKLAYDSLQNLVDKYQVLLVMWDGNIDEREPRPYNVGDHEHVKYEVQMKDYFPELVTHIDSTYRTLADKMHRGIIGFSMGGFMSYFLAGKYPDMIAAATGMTGSPEFFVGTPARHTLYPLRYTFENLREVKLRFHNSTADELTYLNTEVKKGAQWDGLVSFDYWQFVGGHFVDEPGETVVFEKAMSFVADAFEHPLTPTSEWTHHDLYADFEIYGYRVDSDMKNPGFISLHHVKPSGFGITTRRWLPDGPPLDSVTLQLTTPPLYAPNTLMHVVKMRTDAKVVAESNMKTDDQGRLHFQLDGGSYELGIAPTGSPEADIVAVGYELYDRRRMLQPGENTLRLTLLNRGKVQAGKAISLTVTSTDSAVVVSSNQTTVSAGQRIFMSNPFNVRCLLKAPEDAAPPFVRLRVGATIGSETNYTELVVPVLFDVAPFSMVVIDDNRHVNDSTQARGRGNGDGTVNPGERIVLYVDGHPLKLYSDSPHILAKQEKVFDIMVPAKWPDGFTFASIIKVADDCPDGTVIELLGNYETKEFMPIKRNVHWGKVRLVVRRHQTPPLP